MSEEKITVNFIKPDNTKISIKVSTGISLLQAAHINSDLVYLEGSCEGSLACTTCHVFVEDSWYKKLPATTDQEDDLLDFAFDVGEYSRLGCQIKLTKELDGITVKIPSATRNMNLDTEN